MADTPAVAAAAPRGTAIIQNNNNNNNETEIIKKLKDRLSMSEEWCTRLQKQIQDLLKLSYNDTRKLINKMNTPEIAIPLLQCYDATIKEKQDENLKLLQQVDRLRLELRGIDNNDNNNNNNLNNNNLNNKETVKLAEETARCVILRAENDTQILKDEITRLNTENAHYKERIIIINENETRLKSLRNKDAKELEEANTQIITLRKIQSQLEADIENLNIKLKIKNDDDDSDRHAAEAQRIQLHLLTRENEDKILEVERLREKMVTAVKQASENHNTHVKIIEEKYKNNIETLKEEVRSHEVTILKLRAQLSRVDLFNNNNNNNISNNNNNINNISNILSTSETIKEQVYQTQEIEIRKIYAELSSLQMQRDELLFRIEQLTQNNKTEQEEIIRKLKKELELLRGKCNDIINRNGQYEEQIRDLKEINIKIKDENRNILREQINEKKLHEDLDKRHEELKRKYKIIENKLDEIDKYYKIQIEEEKRKFRLLTRREEEHRNDEQIIKEKLINKIKDLEKSLEEFRNNNSELNNKLKSSELLLSERHHLLEISNCRIEQLENSINNHKNIINDADKSINYYSEQEIIIKEDFRKLLIENELLKLENVKCLKEKERCLMEMTAMKRFGVGR